MLVFKKEGESLEEALERTVKESWKQDLAYHEPKNVEDNVRWFDFAVLIIDKDNQLEAKKFVANESESYTFESIMKNFGINKLEKHCLYTLVLNRALNGEIWQYGNYSSSNQWQYYGETRGYA